MSLLSPVVFIIFNRIEYTKRVFHEIARAKPKKLFIIADGPRFDEEASRCEETRAVVGKVDWDCEVRSNFSEHNLGCGERIVSGLDWVFSQVEEAIILEDDCLPSPSFFYYCQTLLDYYRNDERIMVISGDNCQDGQLRGKYSYYFSKYPLIWGWASWRRAWRLYDRQMADWMEYRESDLIKTFWDDPREHEFWLGKLDATFEKVIDTWDYQLFYTCWRQHGLTILPNVNMVSNIGFGEGATHSVESPYANQPALDMWEISHPPYIIRHKEADLYDFHHAFSRGKYLQTQNTTYASLKHRLSTMIRKIQARMMGD